ncbi:accessory Sec system protein translocase subunit SecY2 [Staphylococcus aureus]|uniref:accessory Sec system protein translocase subunit SecY2 n=1 Tax=Staphylococcus aureus TaxID=1280 RepID=UPI001CD24306|nr:accessory Sec system protein translocase subunit SecY2 [Staphylococcus aureus]HBM8032709.1 accessory Sec system protein translocase subunit SecY2 [Staphylococcus aureus]HBM8049410.1 accessory Sec system protein translocase subunit SecY2 [Staphylococcus aureus]
MLKLLQQYEYKIIYKRMLYTCFILFIYILGTNISIVSYNDMQVKHESFFKIAISNMGGDVNTLNIFTLGLGPWLTSMIILMLISYRNMDKYMKQTSLEKHYKERILTLILSVIQSYFVIHEYVSKERVHQDNIYLTILILVTGTMLLVWLADKNSRYGIAGPMPIVMVSIIKSMMHQKMEYIDASHIVIALLIILVIITLFILLFIELVEVRIPYIDLRTLRLVIDMSKEPDLYLQISAISAGIPQINGQQTDYVSDYDNGRIINTVDELDDALNYYLFYLKNWNYAYAYSLKLIDAYASKNIINQLDELIEGENDAT